jgi:hypothetical protein
MMSLQRWSVGARENPLGPCRPILDLMVATVARDVARLQCATFRDLPRLWFATLRDFIKIVVNDRKTMIVMTLVFFVMRPFATLRDLPRPRRDFSRL